MPTLVIHAPAAQVGRADFKRSFEETMKAGIGDEYAINSKLFAPLSPGCPVVLLCKDKQKQAEGILVELKPKTFTKNGIRRYDVHMASLKMVDYRGHEIRLNKCGVAVI